MRVLNQSELALLTDMELSAYYHKLAKFEKLIHKLHTKNNRP